MTGERPGESFLQRDISQANIYRLELIKLVLAMATGMLAFTVSFRPSIAEPDMPWLIQVGWLALAVSIVGGVITMLMWEWFYISYRDFDNKGTKSDGKIRRKTLTLYRRVFQLMQYVGLFLGVIGIGLFAAINIDKPPRDQAGKRAAMEKSVTSELRSAL